jgi:hypothetical protein
MKTVQRPFSMVDLVTHDHLLVVFYLYTVSFSGARILTFSNSKIMPKIILKSTKN